VTPPRITIVPAATPSDLSLIRQLFREYAGELNVDLCFQRFEEELESLPGYYASPQGRLFLAMAGDQVAGCAALRRHGEDVAELKRLFVRPQFRGSGIGRTLCIKVLGEARDAGYSAVVLDTLSSLTAAIRLYESLGFQRVEPYYSNPLPNVVYLRLNLRGTRS
jgi:putative acetyltransferase